MQVSGPVAKDAQAISHLNTEFQSALDEVNRIAKTTQFNGVKSLEGTTAPTSTRVRTLKDILGSSGAPMGFPSSITSFAQVPAGSKNVRIHLYDNGANDDLQVFTTDGRHVAGTPLTSYTWSSNGVTAANVNARVLTEANGFNAGAQYNGSGLVTSGTATVDGTTLTHSGDRNSLGDLNEVVTIPGEVTTPLVILNTGNGWYNIDATWDVMPDASAASGPAIFSPRMVMTSSEAPKGSGLGLPVVNATLAGLGLATLALGSESDAKAALSKVDDAIVQVSSYRVTFGAQMNRMQAAIMTNRAVDVADQETLSRLRDADMAEEVSGRVRDSIVASQGRSVLMQALQVTREMVSSLLRR
jgi:flagellin